MNAQGMAYYLVTAKPKNDRLDQLERKLQQKSFISLDPFGRALSHSLENARIGENGYAFWEEEDYCSPPLKEEREAVLDDFFEDIRTERVDQGRGWEQISGEPKLFPALAKKP